MIKFSILFAILISFSLGEISAQKIDGMLSISGFPNGRTLKEATAVDLFKSFRDGTYKINCSYKADNVGKRGLVIFDMKTTVKHNGKVISESTRSNWPWIPVPPRDAPVEGFVPIESFDLISALQKFTFDVPSANVRDIKRGDTKLNSTEIDLPLPKGKYEVILQMIVLKPGDDLGSISPARFSFVVE
jgi:hypothetical protein